MYKYKKFFCFLFGLAAIIAVGFFVQQREKTTVHAKIGDSEFHLRVARTEGKRSRGLGGTQALAKDEGMLFEFAQDDFHAIWMKDMLIPIDIIWLSDDFSVVDIRKDVSPDTFPEVFAPKLPARFVVELPAGSAEAFGVSIGSRAKFFAE